MSPVDLERIKEDLEENSRWGGETYEFVGHTRALVAEVEALRQYLYEARNPMLPNGETITVGEIYAAWQKAEADLAVARAALEFYVERKNWMLLPDLGKMARDTLYHLGTGEALAAVREESK